MHLCGFQKVSCVEVVFEAPIDAQDNQSVGYREPMIHMELMEDRFRLQSDPFVFLQ